MRTYDRDLDATGLNCPLPILRAKKALYEMKSGEVLRIVATDPGSIADLASFARQTGHILLWASEENGKFIFHIQKK